MSKDKAFKVEKILGQKKQGRNTLVLVKWLGWPSKFNSYVDKKALVDLQKPQNSANVNREVIRSKD